MIISNKGLSPAKDIRIKSENDILFYIDERIKGNIETNMFQLNKLPIFKDGNQHIAPGKDIRRNLGRVQNEDVQKNPYVWVNYSYKSETGETIYSNAKLDLRYLPRED